MTQVGVRKQFSLTEKVEARKKLSKDEMITRMENWAITGRYDKDMKSVGYKSPTIVNRCVDEYFTSERENIRIVDIASGTGAVADELIQIGFKRIDGVDPSQGMRKVAMERKLYSQYYLDYVDGHRMPIDTDKYDCACISSGFSHGLMPTNAIFEILRIVKKGGFIIMALISFDTVDEYRNRFKPLLQRFCDEGVLEVERTSTIHKLVDDRNGIRLVYKVLVSETSIPQLPPLFETTR